MPPWKLELLGHPRLFVDGEAVRFDGKAVALLAYLTVEGTTARARLGGLLWPDSSEERSRNSLRQLLHRLRGLAHGDLVEGSDELSLSRKVSSDVAELLASAREGRWQQAAQYAGELLSGMEFRETGPLSDWLPQARMRLETVRQRAAVKAIEELEREDVLQPALALAEREWARAPLSEEWVRRLMRLHYLTGDRGAALGVYRQCVRRLEEELDTEPSEETRQLAVDVERGSLPRPQRARAVPGQLPVTVLRPPVLAGRAREWAQMEAAWQAGQIILVAGDAGIGKTRLVSDFAASKGAYDVFEGRPGEYDVAYSSGVRFGRRLLAQRPEVRAGLAPWVVREVSRLLPELGDGGAPAPMNSEADRVRFLDAVSELLAAITRGLATVIIDDVHFADPASRDVNNYFLSRSASRDAEGPVPRYIVCFRPAEMPAERLAYHRSLVEARLAVQVDLAPLNPGAVHELLGGLAVPGATDVAPEMSRYTGGNPLFIVETVKHLVETGTLREGWPERLPPPGKVGLLIQRRLERLSPLALQLAQVAALVGTEFDLELAGAVQETHPLALGAALVELEAAQVFHAGGFTHDLVTEAVRSAIPRALATFLHRRLAEELKRRGAAPACVARHLLEGGRPSEAVEPLLAAARQEEAALRFADAAGHAALAARLLEDLGRRDDAARVHQWIATFDRAA